MADRKYRMHFTYNELLTLQVALSINNHDEQFVNMYNRINIKTETILKNNEIEYIKCKKDLDKTKLEILKIEQDIH